MSLPDYADYVEAQGIDPDTSSWLKFEPKWQQDEVRKMIRWIRKHNPVMVIIDSLTSVSSEIEAKENEKEYANSVYELARMNGTEFPSTVFVWIHHNTKGGETFRGTDALRNAVSETWELKDLPPDEQGNYGPLAKMLVVDKSRAGRQGDRMLIDTDVDENVEVRDLTPEESRYQGSGTLVPKTLVLGALRGAERGLTCQEIHEALAERLVGEGTKVPARRSVERWISNWAAQGLILDLGEKRETDVSGKPATVWIHSQNRKNPEREKTSLFSVANTPNPLQENGSNLRQISDTAPECRELEGGVSLIPGETHETEVISDNSEAPEGECRKFVANDSVAPQGVSREKPISDTDFPSPKDGWSNGDPLAGLPLIPMDEFLETYETDPEGDE
jgi:hypothetical protein